MIYNALLIFAVWQVMGLATWLRITLTVVLGITIVAQFIVSICKILAKREERAIKRLEQMTISKQEYSE